MDLCLDKLLAIKLGLQVANDLSFERIILHSDALFVVDYINKIQFSGSLDNIMVDCRMILDSFIDASVMFMSRTLNGDAHFMIGLGKRLGPRTWLGYTLKLNCDHLPVVLLGICLVN